MCIFKDDVKWIGREEVSGELGGRSLVKFPPGLAQREELSRRGQGSLQGEGRSFRQMSHFEGTMVSYARRSKKSSSMQLTESNRVPVALLNVLI